VSVVCGVHGKTTDSWPDVQKSAATSLSELPELPVRVAGYTNSGTGFRADSAHFTTLQAHSDISDNAVDIVLRNDCSMCASTATEHCALVGCAADVEHLCSHWHHLHGQAVSAKSGLRCQHTGIHHTTHARKQRPGNSSAEGLDSVTCAHAFRSNDVALPLRCHVLNQSQVSRAIGIVLNTLYDVLAGLVALEVHSSDSPPDSTTSVSHRDASSVVTPTLSMADFRVCELSIGLAFPEMVVDRALQVAHTGSPGFVVLHLEGSRGLARRRRGCGGCDGGIPGHGAGLQRLFLSRDIAASDGGEQAAVGVADRPYPRLQHCDGVCAKTAMISEVLRMGGGGKDVQRWCSLVFQVAAGMLRCFNAGEVQFPARTT